VPSSTNWRFKRGFVLNNIYFNWLTFNWLSLIVFIPQEHSFGESRCSQIAICVRIHWCSACRSSFTLLAISSSRGMKIYQQILCIISFTTLHSQAKHFYSKLIITYTSECADGRNKSYLEAGWSLRCYYLPHPSSYHWLRKQKHPQGESKSLILAPIFCLCLVLLFLYENKVSGLAQWLCFIFCFSISNSRDPPLCAQAIKGAISSSTLRYWEESELEELVGACGLVEYSRIRRNQFIMISAKRAGDSQAR